MAQQFDMAAMQQQMLQLQQNMAKLAEEKKKERELEYQGPNIRIKLVISDKEFISSTNTLLHKRYGKTLFLEEYAKIGDQIKKIRVNLPHRDHNNLAQM